MMIGTIQLGRVSVTIEKRTPEGVYYFVDAPVLDYFGQRAKPGARWRLQAGIAPADESDQSIVARQPHGLSYGIVRFEGRRADYPYEVT